MSMYRSHFHLHRFACSKVSDCPHLLIRSCNLLHWASFLSGISLQLNLFFLLLHKYSQIRPYLHLHHTLLLPPAGLFRCRLLLLLPYASSGLLYIRSVPSVPHSVHTRMFRPCCSSVWRMWSFHFHSLLSALCSHRLLSSGSAWNWTGFLFIDSFFSFYHVQIWSAMCQT